MISARRNVFQVQKHPAHSTNMHKPAEIKNSPYFLPVVYVNVYISRDPKLVIIVLTVLDHQRDSRRHSADNKSLTCGLSLRVNKFVRFLLI